MANARAFHRSSSLRPPRGRTVRQSRAQGATLPSRSRSAPRSTCPRDVGQLKARLPSRQEVAHMPLSPSVIHSLRSTALLPKGVPMPFPRLQMDLPPPRWKRVAVDSEGAAVASPAHCLRPRIAGAGSMVAASTPFSRISLHTAFSRVPSRLKGKDLR